MSVEINSERFWLPLDISYDEENIIVSGIRAISSIPVAKLRKQCLLNYMETIYRFSKNDYGRTLAILVYKNMSEERKRAKNGRTLKQYLTVTSQTKQIVEICVSHEKTKDCYKELVSIINDHSTDSEAYFFRYYAPRKIFKLTVFGMCFYLPIMINSYRTISICQEIEKISKKILKSARRKKLTNTMETLYKYAFGDEGKEAALNTYLNMSEKRRKSKNGKELREYLEEYATEIIRWHVENAEPEEVYTVLKLNLVSADVLQAIYSELEEDMGIEVKAYFLEMIGKESSINASKEEKWTL